MIIQKRHDAIRLWLFFILSEPLKSGYSDDQLEEVLMREDNKKRHTFKRARMFDAFIKDLQRNWQNFFEPDGNPAGFDGEALILIAIDYYRAQDTTEGYKNCALLRRVLQYYRKKYRRWLPPLSRNREKLERIKKEYRLRYLN
jgi:hypothetical protein